MRVGWSHVWHVPFFHGDRMAGLLPVVARTPREAKAIAVEHLRKTGDEHYGWVGTAYRDGRMMLMEGGIEDE